jgi:anti-sigma factor RsiW
MHLRPDQLVDLAEGLQAESSLPHLAACQECRQQLADLKAMMSAAASVDMPEPSPLFWDHFSARVRGAVAAEGVPRRWLWDWQRLILPVAAAAMAGIILMVVLNTGRVSTPQAGTAPFAEDASVAGVELLSDGQAPGDDTALSLVAELSPDLDFDSAREAGLAAGGSAEHAVTHLNRGELQELQRLLQEELKRPGN